MRMEAVAMMLVGLAHELRNPLTVISSSTQICLSESGLSSAILERLRMIYESSGRANRLIRSSLEFARSRHLELQSVGVNEIVTRAWNAAQLDPLASRASWDVRLGIRRSWSRSS
jgi:signal transduction histidine kinase